MGSLRQSIREEASEESISKKGVGKMAGEENKKLSVAAAGGAAGPAPPSSVKIVLKSADMSDAMRDDAFQIASSAFETFAVEKEIAEHIKKEFDKKHGPTWHCIVGRNFGSYVTHERNHFLYFYADSKAVLLFKSG